MDKNILDKLIKLEEELTDANYHRESSLISDIIKCYKDGKFTDVNALLMFIILRDWYH